jgi:hypothetical protein
VSTFNNTFFRLEPDAGADPAAIIESPLLESPAGLIAKIKKFDGIVLAAWDPDKNQGRVHALGIVQRVNEQSAVVDWRRANFTLRPSPQGATQWAKRSTVEFNEAVATRYRLIDHFHDAFAASEDDTSAPCQLAAESLLAVGTAAKSQCAQPLAEVTAALESTGPQRNRVTPNGEIIATPERGLLMGNRTSPPRWLVCDLHFKRDLKEPRKYTKLFFLDEAVAFAAGHRPCNTCRRAQYQAYLAAVRSDINVSGAGDLDAKLNVSRSTAHGRSPIAPLPDGAFVTLNDGEYRLKWAGALHRWTPGRYVDPIRLADVQIAEAKVVTPEPSLAALRNGYAVVVHASAG